MFRVGPIVLVESASHPSSKPDLIESPDVVLFEGDYASVVTVFTTKHNAKFRGPSLEELKGEFRVHLGD